MILPERLNTLEREFVIHCSPAGAVSSAKEFESNRIKEMPLWSVRVDVDRFVSSRRYSIVLPFL